MAKWTAFPYDAAEYSFDAASLKKKWARLHAGDAEPLQVLSDSVVPPVLRIFQGSHLGPL